MITEKISQLIFEADIIYNDDEFHKNKQYETIFDAIELITRRRGHQLFIYAYVLSAIQMEKNNEKENN